MREIIDRRDRRESLSSIALDLGISKQAVWGFEQRGRAILDGSAPPTKKPGRPADPAQVERNEQYRATERAAGRMCRECSRPPVPGEKRCKECKRSHREAMRRYNARTK